MRDIVEVEHEWLYLRPLVLFWTKEKVPTFFSCGTSSTNPAIGKKAPKIELKVSFPFRGKWNATDRYQDCLQSSSRTGAHSQMVYKDTSQIWVNLWYGLNWRDLSGGVCKKWLSSRAGETFPSYSITRKRRSLPLEQIKKHIRDRKAFWSVRKHPEQVEAAGKCYEVQPKPLPF